jgi:uncharacterized membrane protein YvbJ
MKTCHICGSEKNNHEPIQDCGSESLIEYRKQIKHSIEELQEELNLTDFELQKKNEHKGMIH